MSCCLCPTTPAPRGTATARRQHTILAVGRPTTIAHSCKLLRHAYGGSGHHDMCTKPCQDTSTPRLVSSQPAPHGIVTAQRQHTILAGPKLMRICTNCCGTYVRGPGHHDMCTEPCQDASTPQLDSTQPAPNGIATAQRQHTTLVVGRPTTNAHLYRSLRHTYRGSAHHDMCTKPCQDASTPQPVSTQPAQGHYNRWTSAHNPRGGSPHN